MRNFLFSILLLPTCLQGMYLSINEEVPAAITRYRAENREEHDMATLRQLGLNILKKGIRSHDDMTVLLSILGCGIALHEEATQLLQHAVDSPQPGHQLAALTLLAQQLDSSAADACIRSLGSYFLPVRLEALHLLCQMRLPNTTEHVDALMMKVDEQLHSIFPQLFAMLGDHTSIERIRKMLHSSSQEIRIAAVLHSAATGHDELLPEIRALANQIDPLQQEACAWALGTLHSAASVPRLQEMSKSNVANTKVAALTALCLLGDAAATNQLYAVAKQGNCFAISALAELVGSDVHLRQLVKENDLQVSTNAAIALAQQGDPLCIPALLPLFRADERDLALVPIQSITGALAAWQVVPSARYNMKNDPVGYEIATRAQERLLLQLSQTLPEKPFLDLAEEVLKDGKGYLIPTVIRALETLQTTEAIALLSQYQHKLGDPLTRHYCELALLRLDEKGNHRERLVKWLLKESQEQIIALRPPVPWEKHRTSGVQELCASERSQLLIETFETLAQGQDREGIDALLDAMANGHSTNAYALAGLLIRAAS